MKVRAKIPSYPTGAVLFDGDDIGKLVEGSGVYLGCYAPKDRQGKSLGKVFNVFAAPEDLSSEDGQYVTFTYNELLVYMSSLKNWHGFDGASHLGSTELLEAIQGDRYDGGWIVPPRELLAGLDEDAPSSLRNNKDIKHPHNLFDLRGTGALKGSFHEAMVPDSNRSVWYWSSTFLDRKDISVFAVAFTNGCNVGSHRSVSRFGCRPVRLEEVKP